MVYKITYFKVQIIKPANQYHCYHNCKLYQKNNFDIKVLSGLYGTKPIPKKINLKNQCVFISGVSKPQVFSPTLNSNIPCIIYFSNYERKAMHLIRHLQPSFFLQHYYIIPTTILNHRKRAKYTSYIFQLLPDFFKHLLCIDQLYSQKIKQMQYQKWLAHNPRLEILVFSFTTLALFK